MFSRQGVAAGNGAVVLSPFVSLRFTSHAAFFQRKQQYTIFFQQLHPRSTRLHANMSYHDFNQSQQRPAKACQNFAAGICRAGENCAFDHHSNLDPALVGTKTPVDYMVPDELGVACNTCLGSFREVTPRPMNIAWSRPNLMQCDKVGRGGLDDPCSECRHFGGARRECRLALNSSYNSVAYTTMLAYTDHTLPAYRSPEFSSKGPNQEMPDYLVKADWKGQTRQELIAKPDFLPAGVRDCPRAFTAPPGQSYQRAKTRQYLRDRQDIQTKSAAAHGPSSSLPYHRPTNAAGWPIPPPVTTRPPRDPVAGEPKWLYWAFASSKWHITFDDDLDIQLPEQLPLPRVPLLLGGWELPRPLQGKPPDNAYNGEVKWLFWDFGSSTWNFTYQNGADVSLPQQSPASGLQIGVLSDSVPPPPSLPSVSPMRWCNLASSNH